MFDAQGSEEVKEFQINLCWQHVLFSFPLIAQIQCKVFLWKKKSPSYHLNQGTPPVWLPFTTETPVVVRHSQSAFPDTVTDTWLSIFLVHTFIKSIYPSLYMSNLFLLLIYLLLSILVASLPLPKVIFLYDAPRWIIPIDVINCFYCEIQYFVRKYF